MHSFYWTLTGALRFGVLGFGFRGSGALGFRVLGLGLGAEGLEFRLLGAWGLECPGPR